MPEYLFIYDHKLLEGKEDSNYDPTEAILYFYPSSTSLDYQHSICSHVMGFCQILSNLFQSSPKLFSLDSGAKIACIHEPDKCLITKGSDRAITFALYSDDNSLIHISEKCKLLYESFIFYINKCLACKFRNGKSKSNYVNNILSRLMTIINHRDKLSSIFCSSLYCNHADKECNIVDALVYQTVINISDSIRREAEEFDVSVLGGCLFYKKCLILNQFSVNISNLFSLLIDCINNDLVKTTKETFSSIRRSQIDNENLQTRDGVFLFQICVTEERYFEIHECSNISYKPVKRSCCNSFQYLHLYLEHHSNMTIIFLIDEPDFNKINKELLKVFSNICFNNLGDIEANVATTILTPDIKKERRNSISNVNVWNINFDEYDKSLNSTNNYTSTNIASDWEESLLKRVNVLHENLEKEKTVTEINVKMKKETLSIVRHDGHQIYTMKFSN